MFSCIKQTCQIFNPNIAQDNLDVYTRLFNTGISSKDFHEDIDLAMKKYMCMSDQNISLEYFHSNRELLSTSSPQMHLLRLPPTLDIPALGTDPTEELSAKFDLIASTFNPLYTPDSLSIRPNVLLFQYKGICHTPFSLGESSPQNRRPSCLKILEEDLEISTRLRKDVNEAHSIGLDDNQGPTVILLPYDQLKKHINESNEILRMQYASSMRHESLSKLRETVISHHGKDSIVALLLHLEDTEALLNTFVPRGVCSSICTGKTAAYTESSTYQGVVTIQRSGTLNVDVEDADQHLVDGSEMNIANLFLIIEMKQLVPLDDKFNYPSVRLVLTSHGIDQFEEELVRQKHRGQRSASVCSRDGRPAKTIIYPIASLRVGPYHVYSNPMIKRNQVNEFDITMSLRSALPRYI